MIRESYNRRWQMEERYTRLKLIAVFFTRTTGMVASANLGWPQTAFDTLTGIFNRVGL